MASDIIPKVDLSNETTSSNLHTTKKVVFRVRTPNLKNDETVFITGNTPELGSWQPEKSMPLQPENDKNIWSATVELSAVNRNTQVEFRYCICILLEPGTRIIIKSWETFLNPRMIEIESKSVDYQPEPHIYGVNHNDGIEQISRGWLTTGIIVHLKLLNNCFKLWTRKFARNKVYIRVTPVDLRELDVMLENPEDTASLQNSKDNSPSTRFAFTEVGSLTSDDPRFRTQDQFGTELNFEDESNVLIFQNVVLFPQVTAFLIDFYSSENSIPKHLGFGYLLPSAFQSSEGSVQVSVSKTSGNLPLGELTLSYLVIRPLPNSNQLCDMNTTFARYWKRTISGLDVGHRGSGSSFTNKVQNCAEVRENTIASFKNAIEHGADFIEFDVQLSKDLVPLIYHDFNVCICTRRKKNLEESIDVLQMPVKELTEEQLKMLKIFHVAEGNSQKFFDEDLEDHQPFPSLQHLLLALDPYVGFNVEIKRPMLRSNGTYTDESNSSNGRTDLNLYLDTILGVLLRYAGTRRIVFSCFDPDVCISLRMKQHKYPVMLLTVGENLVIPKHLADPRTWSLKAAVNCAIMFEILGVCAHIQVLLRFPFLVNFTISSNLILFCWGDEAADPNIIRKMKELGIHGVIYDKIHQHSNKAVKESIFLIKAKEKQKNLMELNSTTKQ